MMTLQDWGRFSFLLLLIKIGIQTFFLTFFAFLFELRIESRIFADVSKETLTFILSRWGDVKDGVAPSPHFDIVENNLLFV